MFFDRDGVLNRDVGFAHRPDQIDWVPGALEAVRLCRISGFLVFVVTNQSGVARGLYDEAAVLALHDWMARAFAAAGGRIDAFRYCPHHPAGSVEAYRRSCACRKPGAGMILDCLERFPVDRGRSFLVGDRSTDLDAAAAAGIAGHLFEGQDLLSFITPLLAAQAEECGEPSRS